MKKLSIKKYVLISAIIVIGIVLDQVSKILTVNFIPFRESIPIIKNFFSLTYIVNYGAAWGMLDNARWVFISISTVAIIAMLIYLYLGFAQNTLYEVSLAIIISGGIGNMIDRLGRGYVVDMLSADFIDFPVFNVADSFVCVGAGMLILALVLDIVKESKAAKEKKNDSDGN